MIIPQNMIYIQHSRITQQDINTLLKES